VQVFFDFIGVFDVHFLGGEISSRFAASTLSCLSAGFWANSTVFGIVVVGGFVSLRTGMAEAYVDYRFLEFLL